MKKKALSLTLALVMCLGLTVPAFAADNGIRVMNTGIQADSVVNYDGYGSLKIGSNIEDEPDDYGNYIGTPAQLALIDRDGKFVFPYREDPIRETYFEADARFYCSDGTVSLTLGNCYYNGGVPEYYDLDGNKAFILEMTDEEYTENGIKYHNWTSWLGGPIHDGYAVVIQKLYSEWTGSWAGGGSSSGDNRTLIIDKSGKVTCELPSEYNAMTDWGESGFGTRMSLGWCGEGLFAFYSHTLDDETWNFFSEVLGYMDPTGKTVIDLKGQGYIDAFPFYEGLAAVKNQENKIGFIDKTGKLVIPCIYDGVNHFCDGLCGVMQDGKCGYIDRAGNTVIPLIYDDVYGAGNSLAAVVRDGKCGLVDYHNNIVVPLEYDDISSYHGGIAYGIKDGTVHLISGYHAGVQAMPTNDKLTRDGEPQDPTVYKIGDSNYFKIRDLAAILNGTGKQFSVGYDSEKQSVTVTTGEAYTMTGTELKGAASSNETAQISNDAIYVNGQKVEAEVYKIGGNNYFKLRDLGKALDFYVGWSVDKGMYIDSGRSYGTD